MNKPARVFSIATAVPPHKLRQQDVECLARSYSSTERSTIDRLLPVYGNAGIETRYSCVAIDWYLKEHSWSDRARVFVDGAVSLLEQAARQALTKGGVGVADVDALVVASTTGIATPSLDALLIERLATRRDVRRLPIFGLGCAGGAVGLARAAEVARALDGGIVLFLVVELCTLTFRIGDTSPSNVVATALFGDGAAAALLSTDASGPAVLASGEHTWAESLDIMGWRIEDDGLGVLFSRDIPTLVRTQYRAALDGFLDAAGIPFGAIDEFVCHPGGAKVVDALEEALGLQHGTMRDARSVLRDYGNMSAATVLFVLERSLARTTNGTRLLSSLGPGFTAGFLALGG
jgi:alkylresorcinol/alkylpyrone synthase